MFRTLLGILTKFVQDYYVRILIILGVLSVSYLIYYITTGSLKKLKKEAFASYPFDLFFPHGGTWSVGYFLIMILVFGALIYFLIKGKFFLVGPA